MAFQPVPDAVEIVLEYTRNNMQLRNVLHAKFVTGRPEQTEMQDLADDVAAWGISTWAPVLDNNTAFDAVTVRGLSEALDNQATASGSATSGTGGVSTLPNNVTKAFTLRSGLTGRSGRGRLYLPGLPTGALEADENYITVAYLNDVVDALDDLIGVTSSIGFELSIVSRQQGGAVLPVGVSFAVVSVGYSDVTTDSMRSRLP